MNKTLLLLLIPSLLLVGCKGRGGNTGTNPTSGNSDTSLTSSVPGGSNTSGTSNTGASTTSGTTASGTTSGTSATSSSSSTSSTPPPAVDIITNRAANAKGEALKTQVPSGEHQYFSDEVVGTKGRIIQCIDVKVYQTFMIYIADGEDMVPLIVGSQDDFYSEVKNKIGREDSNYIVYGKIGYYYGHPAIELTNYELKESMTFDIDYSTYDSTQYTSIDTYNEALTEIDYNRKGHGVGDLITFKSLKCLAKADDNSWLFSDGSYVQGGYHQTSNTAFTIGKVYDLFGFACVYAWKPSIRVLEYKVSSEVVDVDIPTLAADHEKTAAQMYSVGAPNDDTDKSTATNNFLRTFKYFYKSSDAYFNVYGQKANGYYMVASQTYYDSTISSKETASQRKMFKFNNDAFNTFNDLTHVSVRDYVCQNRPLTMYFVEYQFTTIDGREVPQVYMFEEFVPILSFPDLELRRFFSSQTYLINEGQIPEFDGGSLYEIRNQTDAFEVLVSGVTQSEYDTHVSECNSNAKLTHLGTSSETDNKYKHSATNPKFTYEVIFDSSQETMHLIIDHYS